MSHAVFMPTEYSASESGRDAEGSFRESWDSLPGHTDPEDTFEKDSEDARAGVRQVAGGCHRREPSGSHSRQHSYGALNKFRGLVLSTGNKSEMSVGYSTLYGDYGWRLCHTQDVPKTLVYKLRRTSIIERLSRLFRSTSSRARHRRNCGRTRRTRTLCLLYRFWMQSSKPMSRRISRRRRDLRRWDFRRIPWAGC